MHGKTYEAHRYRVNTRDVHPPKPMMHIAYSPISTKFKNFTLISVKFIYFTLFPQNLRFLLNLCFLLPPILTMMHLCIMLYMYCMPLINTNDIQSHHV